MTPLSKNLEVYTIATENWILGFIKNREIKWKTAVLF